MKKNLIALTVFCIFTYGTLSYAASVSVKSAGIITYEEEGKAVKFDSRDIEKIFTELEVISNETSGDIKNINNKIASYEEHCK